MAGGDVRGDGVRYVRVTTSSPSWVAWAEIEVYGAGGGNGAGEVNWLMADHLGTPRMVADLSGSLQGIRRHDYLPFGEEIGAGVGGRTQQQGYVADSVRQQFTGKERDDETGLDYFQARYYSPAQGRFTTVDPYNPLDSDGSLTSRDYYSHQPQHWNRYTYALNNPHKYVDPDGRNPLVLTALGGAVGGAIIGGGFEIAKALYRGESLSDPNVRQRVYAKAINGAIFGGVAGLTGNLAAAEAAVVLAGASVVGGAVERYADGNDQTNALSLPDASVDAVAGFVGGYAGQKMLTFVSDGTYASREAAYQSFEAINGSLFKSMEKSYLNSALSKYKYTFNVNPRFLSPEGAASGLTRGGAKAGLTFSAFQLFQFQYENEKRKYRDVKNCPKCKVTVKVCDDEGKNCH